MWRKLAGIESSVWLICGHTHIPAIDHKDKTANCGGWIIPAIRTSVGYGVLISSNVSLVKIAETSC